MGRIPPYPRCFRKSGKERTYGLRNLEECTENGRRAKDLNVEGIDETPAPYGFCNDMM
jgi:hypothetical protein